MPSVILTSSMSMDPTRGEVWWVDFDPTMDAEIGKVRPAVVVSVKSVGKLPLRIVVPITDWKPSYLSYPWMTYVSPTQGNGLAKESAADAFQVKSVARSRIKQRLGYLTPREMEEIAAAIALCVGHV